MYFYKELTQRLDLKPEDFDATLQEKIERRLRQKIEGECLGGLGYVIAVMKMHEEGLDEGLLNDVDGTVTYNLKCDAVVCRPFKNEVVDALVIQCNELGFFCSAGPVRIFVSRHGMPEDLQNGFKIQDQAWVTDDGEVRIEPGCAVRVRILNVSVQANEISAIASISDDYMGLILSAEEGATA